MPEEMINTQTGEGMDPNDPALRNYAHRRRFARVWQHLAPHGLRATRVTHGEIKIYRGDVLVERFPTIKQAMQWAKKPFLNDCSAGRTFTRASDGAIKH